MKTFCHLWLCLLVCLAPGCLRVENTLTIKKDGSGEIDLEYSVSESAIRQLKAMRKLQGQMAMAAEESVADDEETRYAYMFLMPDEDQIRRECERYARHGITVDNLKIETRNAWRHVDMKILFTNLKGLAATDVFKYVGFALAKNSDGNYVFYRAAEPKQGFNPPDCEDPTVVRMLSPILGGFRVNLILKTPGRIVRTNASRKSGYTSIWTYDFERDPAAVVKIQTHRLITIFDSSGLDLPEIRQN